MAQYRLTNRFVPIKVIYTMRIVQKNRKYGVITVVKGFFHTVFIQMGTMKRPNKGAAFQQNMILAVHTTIYMRLAMRLVCRALIAKQISI